MKKLFLLLFLIAEVSTSLFSQNQKPVMQQLQVDLVYLASDYLEGRESGKKGAQLAADYIASRYTEIGLSPKGDEGSWFQAFDFTFKPNPHAEKGESRTGRNVVGFLDNGAASTVVIGAHYDHLGYGISGSLDTGDPAVHNGADDNASGVTALLRIAAYLQEGHAKNNNYLFLAFSGEELGLYGSKNFVNNPSIDLGNVNYMLNMDMVGRLKEEKVLAVSGAGTSPLWKGVLENIEVAGIKAKTSDSGIGPSDHTSFYLEDIPVLHFFTGQHGEYHKPADDAQLINFQGLLDVTDFIIALIEQLDDDGRLVFTKTKNEDEGRRAASFKVTLGVMPDYVFDGQGMRIDGVMDDRPAAKAGLQKGDVVIQMGDVEVKDMYSYMDGLSKFKKGEKTIVKVKRGEEVIEVEVEF